MAFPNTSVIDDFNRADEDPISGGGLWTSPLVRLDWLPAVISNIADNVHGWASAYRNNITPTDLEVFGTIPAGASAGANLKLFWRITSPNSTSTSGYSAEFNVDNHIKVYEITNEVYTLLSDIDTTAVGGVDNGDQCGVQMVGNTIKIFVNGTQVGSDITNSAHTGSGRIGFGQFSFRGVDDFGGGAYAGSAPTNATPPIITGTPAVGTSLGYGSDTWNNSPTSFTRQWLIETAIGSGSYQNIPGATSTTYTPVSGDVGKKLKITVIASNAFGSASATSAASAAVQSGLGAGSAFPSTATRDNCTRADEAPLSNGGNWTSPINVGDYALKLLSNQILSNGAGWGSAYWNTANFGPNCEVWGQMDSVGDTGWEYRLWLNVSNPNNSTRTGYQGRFIKYVGVEIWRFDGAAAPTKIATFTGMTWTANATVGLRRVGNTLLAFVNGEVVGQVIDNTYAVAGRIGMEIFSTGSGFRSFGGGDYTGPTAPPYTPRIWWMRYHRIVSAPFTVQSSLSGTLTAPVPWTATPSQPVSKVDFYIDGVLKWTELISPYDYNGSPDGVLDPSTLTNGTHTFTLVATAADGSQATSIQPLLVSTTATPPPPPPSTGGEGTVNHTEPKYASGGWQYVDLLAIYNPGDGAYADANETQLLHSALPGTPSNRLYIPFALPGQWSADPGSVGWRNVIIGRANSGASTHVGIMVDDINPGGINTTNSTGTFITPMDQRTGQLMTVANWDRYHAEFCEAIEAGYAKEIVHNTVPYAGHGSGTGPSQRGWVLNSYIARIIASCDWMMIERGINDNFNGGNGKFSWQNLFEYVDYCHSVGTDVVWFSYATDATSAEYQLAAYFLFSNGNDLVKNSGNFTWYNSINLGDAVGSRYQWNGLWRRDFVGGFVLLNPPGATTQSPSLGGSFLNVNGGTVSSVSLAAARGAVLRKP